MERGLEFARLIAASSRAHSIPRSKGCDSLAVVLTGLAATGFSKQPLIPQDMHNLIVDFQKS
jgi:hypothetical protein